MTATGLQWLMRLQPSSRTVRFPDFHHTSSSLITDHLPVLFLCRLLRAASSSSVSSAWKPQESSTCLFRLEVARKQYVSHISVLHRTSLTSPQRHSVRHCLFTHLKRDRHSTLGLRALPLAVGLRSLPPVLLIDNTTSSSDGTLAFAPCHRAPVSYVNTNTLRPEHDVKRLRRGGHAQDIRRAHATRVAPTSEESERHTMLQQAYVSSILYTGRQSLLTPLTRILPAGAC